MPVVNFALSLDRTRFARDRHVGKGITENCNSDFTALAGSAE